MKDLFASEIGYNVESTFSFYRKKEDEKPAGSAKFAIGFRVPLGRLLIACAATAVTTGLLFLGASFDRREAKK